MPYQDIKMHLGGSSLLFLFYNRCGLGRETQAKKETRKKTLEIFVLFFLVVGTTRRRLQPTKTQLGKLENAGSKATSKKEKKGRRAKNESLGRKETDYTAWMDERPTTRYVSHTTTREERSKSPPCKSETKKKQTKSIRTCGGRGRGRGREERGRGIEQNRAFKEERKKGRNEGKLFWLTKNYPHL